MQINKNNTKNKTNKKWDKMGENVVWESDSDGLKQSGFWVGDFKLSIWEFL